MFQIILYSIDIHWYDGIKRDLVKRLCNEKINYHRCNWKRNQGVKMNILEDDETLQRIENVADEIISAFKNNNKVLFCGNGGSVAHENAI